MTNGSREVSLYVASYIVKRRGVKLVNPSNAAGVSGECDLLSNDNRQVKMDSRLVTVAEYVFACAGQRRLVWIWYLSGDELTASPYRIKLIQAESRLAGRPLSVVLFAVAARFSSQPSEAVEDLSDFVRGMSFPGLRSDLP